jgi:hypothetical protein
LGTPLLPFWGFYRTLAKDAMDGLYINDRDHIHDLGNGWQFHLHHKVDAEG